MKKKLLFILFSLGLATLVLASDSVDTKQFKYYIHVQEALAADDFKGAKGIMSKWLTSASSHVKKWVKKGSEATDIKGLRSAFEPISMWVAKQDLPKGFALAFCPMVNNNKGAHWVQKEGKINNPYFGSMMLRCGSFKK